MTRPPKPNFIKIHRVVLQMKHEWTDMTFPLCINFVTSMKECTGKSFPKITEINLLTFISYGQHNRLSSLAS